MTRIDHNNNVVNIGSAGGQAGAGKARYSQSSNSGGSEKISGAEEARNESARVQKNLNKALYIGGGVTALGLLGGAAKWGSSHPAKVLQVVGDGAGSVAALAAPFSIISNELRNYNLIKDGKPLGGADPYDNLREGFYRIASLGFTPFIFKPFIDPEQFGKSVFHKAAAVANVPNLLFTGYTWGIGNLKAFATWVLKYKAQNDYKALEKSAPTEGKESELVKCESRIHTYEKTYDSCKRLATIGSIANPTMQGLRQCADSLAFISGQMDSGEFFSSPFLGVSRLTSLFVGVPEVFAKWVDSFGRITKEFDHLKDALPQPVRKPLGEFSKKFQDALESDDKNTLKSVKNAAEVIFHTLSPLSMFALFAPLLDDKHQHEDLQAEGGAPATFDKIISGYGKTLTYVFTGSYAFLARLPQAVFQFGYFSKVGFGPADSPEKVAKAKAFRKAFVENPIVSGLSNASKSIIEKLVPDFYKDKNDVIDYGYATYEQIQAKHAINQLAGKEKYKPLFDDEVRADLLAEDGEAGQRKLDELTDELVVESQEYAVNEARKGEYTMSDEEAKVVGEAARKKIGFTLDPNSVPAREKPLFPGAEFLVRYLFKLGDLKTRIESLDYRSSHHNRTTAYDLDEIRIAFEGELMPVIAKCTKGLGCTANRVYSLFGMAA